MTETPAPRLDRPAGVTLLALANLVASLLLLSAPFLLADSLRRHAVLGTLFLLVVLPIGLVALACAWALWSLRPVGRHLQIGLASCGLLAFPVGTVVGLVVLAYLFQPRTRLLFSDKQPPELSEGEIELLSRPESSGPLFALLAGSLLFLVCALLAALTIPRFLFGDEGERMQRTIADIRRIGEGLEAFAQDHGSYPAVRNVEELSVMLEPRYLSPLPRRDGWNRLFDVRGDHAGYVIRSAGADRRFERIPQGGATRGAGADIIFSNGTFVQYPEKEF